jgi:hypothetical protein
MTLAEMAANVEGRLDVVRADQATRRPLRMNVSVHPLKWPLDS